MNLTTFTEGGALAASRQPRAQDVISYLGARVLGRRLGVNFPEATAADFSAIPRVATGADLTFVGEGGAPAEAALAFGQIQPSLRTGIAWTDLSFNFWRTAGNVSDQVVTRELFGAAARGIDRVLFHGDGGLEPLGIANVPTVDTRTGATFALATAAAMLRAVEDANADPDFISWAMAPDVAEILRQRERGTAGIPGYLLDGGKILDRPAFVSNSIAAGHLFLGDFTQATALIRDVELLLDRSSKSTQGAKRLVVFVHLDIAIHQPECFAVATEVS
jgi:HK97 family phage major capsid protein